MAEFKPRQFQSDTQIREIGEGLLACSLPKHLWTHEAHFAATTYLILCRPDIQSEVELPGFISRYNVASGGMNTDTGGYHETITQFNIRVVREFLKREFLRSEPLFQICNRLVKSPVARRDFPLKFYSPERLFSVAARKTWVEPDLASLEFERYLKDQK